MTHALPVILILGPRSLPLALRIKDALPEAELHAPACAACPADRRFDKLAAHAARCFAEGRPLIGICAAGILIRALAPVLGDKHAEPPVLAVAEDGRVVVPLLGGHRGGNELARLLATALAAVPAITTAGDARFGLALDAPPPGWHLAEPKALAAGFMAALLEGARVRLVVEAGDADWLRQGRLPWAEDAAGHEIRVTAEALASTATRLVYHPPVLALGVGAERHARPEALEGLVRQVLAEHRLAPEAIAGIFSFDLKAAEPALHRLAATLDRPLRFFDQQALEAERARLATPSAMVEQATGLAGIAEAAALAAAGPKGWLLVAKRVGEGVTCAVAMAPVPIGPALPGRPQGRLLVTGIGPGDHGSRTGDMIQAIGEAEDLVGYGLYLDLVADLAPTAIRHAFPLGAETERCRRALDLAAGGRRVVLLGSGDAGIYAMAALVLELLAGSDDPAWARLELGFQPGISAMQAASARAGAILGHDFAAVSLSDLLTPWPVIEQRLLAAAAGDFVTALYNPVSARRRTALGRARAIFLEQRPATTPVVIARNLGRDGERVQVTTLAELSVDDVDMLTIVIVGSRSTRRLPALHGPDRVFTPRGYPVP